MGQGRRQTGRAAASMTMFLILGMMGVGVNPAYSSNTASSTVTITLRCDGGLEAHIPQTHYIVTTIPGNPSAPAGCNSELQVTEDIGIDGRVEGRCDRTRDGIQIVHKTPAMKLTGMLCQPAARAELQITNSTAEGGGGIAMLHSGQSPKADDFLGKEETRPLFGADGVIRNAGIRDGEDYDRFQNGEVVFAGTSSETGGTVTVVNISQRALDGDSSANPQIALAFSAH